MNKEKEANKTRVNQENGEGQEAVKVSAPNSRFQDTQQIQTAVNAGSNNAPDESFIPKKSTSAGHVLRQEVAAEVVKGKSGSIAGGVSSPSSYGLREMTFSGDASTILGNAGGTPTLSENIQGKTRLDKRLSDANKDINYNASEQVYVEYKMIDPLAESKSTVGYNGNPKNAAVRAQKNTGLTPAEELYDRSLDIVTQDYGVFVSGQRIEQAGVNNYMYPTVRDVETDDHGVERRKQFSSGKGPVSGNFMPVDIEVKVSRDSAGVAYISGFKVNELDLSANEESASTVNVSSSNAQIDRNKSELIRQTIDAKAGSPSQSGFNPLGRSVQEPTQTVTLLRDIEAATGATVFAAYKFAQKARGHYLNRTAKDGQDLTGPAIDALYGGLTSANNLNELKALLGESIDKSPLIFNAGLTRGSAALMLSIFDSTSKYKTKADIINQPRSLKMHLQTADNNMNPFRCKKEFISALNSIDVYSTIDHEYDPMSPVYISDNFKLIYPYSWKNMLEFTRSAPGKRTYTSELFSYFYNAGAGQNRYLVNVAEPTLNGVAYFFDMHAESIANALGLKKSSTETITIPVVHSTTHFSLWDYLICACTPYIIYERTNSLKDILDYEMNFEYPFNDFVSIKDANPMNAVNYGNPSALAPLEIKQMLPSSAIRWKYPEMLYPLGNECYLLPFYFSERDVEWGSNEWSSDATIIIDGCENFTTPIIRSGIKLGGLDSFFDMDVKDQLLNFDIMTRMPGVPMGSEVKGGVYKYAQGSDGIPFIKSTDSYAGACTVINLLATPRQLGWFMSLPGGVASGARDGNGDACFNDAVGNIGVTNMFDAGPSFRAIMYKGGITPETAPTAILGEASLHVSRGQNFVQHWQGRYASRYGGNAEDFDLMLSPLDGFKSTNPATGDISIEAVKGKTMFRPFTIGRYSTSKNNTAESLLTAKDNYPMLFSVMRIYWAAFQKLPFIINPFAAYADASAEIEGYADPFDIAYLFGLCGFAAANYYEEVYNRANQVLNQGYGYTVDPMVNDSPVFVDSRKYTEIG